MILTALASCSSIEIAYAQTQENNQMENPVKTNRLAIVSFASGLIGLISLGIILLPVLFLASPGDLPEFTGPVSILMDASRSLSDLATILAFITGILALRDIKKKVGMEKGKTLAWVGIIVGAGWILFRVVVALIFILALFFPVR